MKKAFTMIELIFVIVVIGILTGIAMPKLVASRDDAEITKAKAAISAIQSSIAMVRSQNLMSGNAAFPDLEEDPDNAAFLFEGVLDRPIIPRSANQKFGWTLTGTNAYTYKANKVDVSFTYNNGIFTCVPAAGNPSGMCITLLQ